MSKNKELKNSSNDDYLSDDYSSDRSNLSDSSSDSSDHELYTNILTHIRKLEDKANASNFSDEIFKIILAASKKDYETLKTLSKPKDYRDADKVELIIRNLIIKNKDIELLYSYPIKFRLALEENLNNLEDFEFLVQNLFGENSKFCLDVPSYVFRDAPKKALEILIKYNQHPYFEELTKEGKLNYLEILNDYEMSPRIAKDVLEHLMNKYDENDIFIKDNEYIKILSDFGYELPRRGNKSDYELICKFYKTLEKK